MTALERFLHAKARDVIEICRRWGSADPVVSYSESVNPDACDNTWLENGTSYIWKVGVLLVADGNKKDWARLFIGHHRSPTGDCEFIGQLRWRDGKNDDPGHCLKRYVECASGADIMFDNL